MISKEEALRLIKKTSKYSHALITSDIMVTSEILMERLPQDCPYAIKSHDYRTGFKPKSNLDKALIIADALARLIEKMEGKIPSLNYPELKLRGFYDEKSTTRFISPLK